MNKNAFETLRMMVAARIYEWQRRQPEHGGQPAWGTLTNIGKDAERKEHYARLADEALLGFLQETNVSSVATLYDYARLAREKQAQGEL